MPGNSIPENPRVLFVDDEPNILGAMRRMIRMHRPSWTILCAQSGESALECLDENPVDVVVSDMMMPGMTGGQLLEKVRQRFPGTLRIALSGQVGLPQVMESIRCVHHYISKPCSAEALAEKIETALEAGSFIPDRQLREHVANPAFIPVQASVFERLMLEFEKPDPSLEVIVDQIKQDISLTATMLSLVSSPFFGLPRKLESITEAFSMLGLEVITGILPSSLLSPQERAGTPGFSLELLNDHSRRVRSVAGQLAIHAGASREVASRSFISGMMHDFGKTILATTCAQKFSEAVDLVEKRHCTLSQAEREVLGTTHAEVGAYFLALQGLDRNIVQAVRNHHHWSEFDMSEVMFLHIADVMDHQCVRLQQRHTNHCFSPEMVASDESAAMLFSWGGYIQKNWDESKHGVSFDSGRLADAIGASCRTSARQFLQARSNT